MLATIKFPILQMDFKSFVIHYVNKYVKFAKLINRFKKNTNEQDTTRKV